MGGRRFLQSGESAGGSEVWILSPPYHLRVGQLVSPRHQLVGIAGIPVGKVARFRLGHRRGGACFERVLAQMGRLTKGEDDPARDGTREEGHRRLNLHAKAKEEIVSGRSSRAISCFD
jgi:hypothetical protein